MRSIGLLFVFAAVSVQAGSSIIVTDRSVPRHLVQYSFPGASVLQTFGVSGASGMGLVLGPDGVLYVADEVSGVKKYNPVTGQYLGIGADGTSGAAFGVAFHPSGVLLVTNPGGNAVFKYNPGTGAYIGPFTGISNMSASRGLAVSPEGDVFVCGQTGVYRFNGTTGAFVRRTACTRPDQCAFGPDGRLYVSHESNTIWVINPTTGQFLGDFVNSSQGLVTSRGLAWGPDGNLYVANSFDGKITQINGTTGLSMSVFSQTPAGVQPLSMIFGPGPTRVSGKVQFRYLDYFAPDISSVQAEYRDVSTGNLVLTTAAFLSPDGSFDISGPEDGGHYELSVKYGHWLRRTVQVDLTQGTVSGVFMLLDNGDADGDNEVGLGDFGILSTTFGSIVGGSGYDDRADFDLDGEVGLVDFAILSASFGLEGDN